MLTKDKLKEVFDLYYEALVMYANRFLESKAECEDLVQDVLVTMWESNNSFSDDISIKVYLYKAVRNKCYNVIKHQKVKIKYQESTIKSLDDDNLFLNQILEEEVVRQLYIAIEKLPVRKKEIIKLSLKGLRNIEISERLGIKLQTVKTLKSQSYNILREEFKDLSAIIYFLLIN
ncbi:sigma-70 family RNA polymerase sigma factor [Aestuariibaculum lutulentum]|uniref:Sigma-70 family RNA polymerase sigma factor n=1 Tax=Aestuariibaculum lutulentum TaxID=2920935 RepID=A0ABS9RKI0_9FLAO|nr:sigma-70 family RNA polymerase sigma factor [Aestuariibaculum lutulentum]MCH4553453.1 sigma-70 family RNA polymerase sigma factor [Aestuariibaculum lutulentum]